MFLPGEDRLCLQAAGVYTWFVDAGQGPKEREAVTKTRVTPSKDLETKGLLGLFELKSVDSGSRQTKADYLERVIGLLLCGNL